MAFWIASYCLSIAALVLCGASLAYVLRLRKGKASEIEAALAREVSAGQGPDPVAGGQEFAAHRNVDPQTGKVIYDMRPAPHSRTEVGTFAYVLAIAGIAALLPVYGLAAALAAGVLAPLAARRFDPSLERTVGFKLIVFSVAAACCGALASLLSCMGAFRAEPAGAPDVILPAGQLPELPIYVPLSLLGVLVI